MKELYLDNAATTPVRQEVIKAMESCWTEIYGNASSIYELGVKSRDKMEESRSAFAEIFHCSPSEIYFTSGGTESNNWAIKGIAFENKHRGMHIITSVIEHPSVMNSCAFLESLGFRITYIPVDRNGHINFDKLKKAISKDTILISIMAANNEVGTLQPIKEISEISLENSIYFHTDAVQLFCKKPINLAELPGVDLLSISSHKFNGPKGVGVLFIREGTRISSFMNGGSQEKGLRAGTENIPGIIGMAKAAELWQYEIDERETRIQTTVAEFLSLLKKEIPFCKINSDTDSLSTGIVNVTFPGINALLLLSLLDAENVYVSNGSACSCKKNIGSKTLIAMGRSTEESKSSIRFSFGCNNTPNDAHEVIEVLKDKLYRINQFKKT